MFVITKLKNNKGFTMTEILVTLIFMSLFATMVIIANRMLSTIAVESVTFTQQQTLANAITSAMLIEMRDATNISLFTGNNYNGTGNYYDGTNTHHDTAKFVYDSKKFNFLQSDHERTYRELIYVDSTSGKLYVGRAPNKYSLSTTIQSEADNYNESAKALIGLGLYKDNIVKLNNNESGANLLSTSVKTPTLSSETEITQHAQFQLSLFLQDTTTGVTFSQDMLVYTNISS